MRLTNEQERVINALACGHRYLSASEHAVKDQLLRLELVRTWETIGGFPAWGLSDRGWAYLRGELSGDQP